MGERPTDDWSWWRERRLPAAGLYLDTAAAGRSSRATLAAAASYAEREATAGAYVAQAEAEPVLAEGQARLAGLLGVPRAGVAFVEGAEAALGTLLRIWPLRDDDTVAIVPPEWGPNLDMFTGRGLRLAEIATHGDGAVDLAALDRMLAGAPPAVVHLVQVTSHRGLVQPVAEAAALCRAAGVPLWVDAAQALGHVDIACGADAVYATSRKWLTGPRGVGLLGISEPWWDRLPREALAGLPGWALADPVDAPSAIVALRAANGQDVAKARTRLLAEHDIVTTAATPLRAPRDMTEPLLRISPHVDLAPADLSRLTQALCSLA